MKFGLDDTIIDKIVKVFEGNPKVDKAYIFGSRAKGNYRAESDIDIAIKGFDISMDDVLTMGVAFEENGIKLKVDLVDYDAIKESALVEHVDRVGVEVYSRWRECKLGELLETVTKGTTPTTEGGRFIDAGINFIKSEGISYDGKIDRSTFAFIDTKTHEKLKRSQLKKDDILFSMAGIFLGKNAIVTEDILPANTNQALAIIRLKKDVVEPKFIHYYLRQKSVIELVNNMSGQSAQPNINFEEIKSIDVVLPNIEDQRAIVNALGSLDNKIDLLHRQNKTLEQLAETLFRQWFEDESEEHWEVFTIKDIAIHRKQSVSPSAHPNTLFYHYSLPAFDEGKSPKLEIGREILSNKYLVTSNSILVSKLNPRFPRIWSLYEDDIPHNSICSTEFQVIQPKNESYFGYIYFLLKSKRIVQKLTSSAGGTSGSHQRVTPDDIFNLTFFNPPMELIVKFNSIVKHELRKILLNEKQIQILIRLRDTLLPKLMSGDIRVKIPQEMS